MKNLFIDSPMSESDAAEILMQGMRKAREHKASYVIVAYGGTQYIFKRQPVIAPIPEIEDTEPEACFIISHRGDIEAHCVMDNTDD